MRKSEQVRQLNTLFFDLDCHDRDLQETRAIVSQTLDTLKQAVGGGALPQPTMTIDTGRGVQLFYILTRSIPYRVSANGQVNIKSVKLFENVQKRMASLLDSVVSSIRGISVDRATFDVSRVSRIPGTFNAKARRYASLCDYSFDALYSLSKLSGLIPHAPSNPTAKPISNALSRRLLPSSTISLFWKAGLPRSSSSKASQLQLRRKSRAHVVRVLQHGCSGVSARDSTAKTELL